MKNGKRRGATKVPNVILRPPPPISNSKGVASTSSTQHDDNDPSDLNFREGLYPLRGVVLCATGKLDKVTLFAHAVELGASRSNDFTDQVTHLVADAPGSAKYKCAVQCNLPILKESWVNDIYKAWLAGESIDFNQFVAKHRLPIFTGVQLCITGVQDTETRERIATILKEQGGIYSKSLDSSTTHLLCSESTSDKVVWAKRMNQERGKKKIYVVWEEWFWDCLEFGRWDDEQYDINRPRPTKKSVDLESQKTNKQGTILPSDTLYEVNSLPKSLPSVHLTGDDEAPELGQTQKQKGVGLRILRNIVHTRKFPQSESEDPIPVISIDASALAERNAIVSSEHGTDSRPDSLKATSFLAPLLSQSISQISLQSTCSIYTAESFSNQPIPDIAVTKIFAGYSFRALGEAKEGTLLRDAVNKHGGRWLDSDDTSIKPDFFLVRLVRGNTFWNEVNSKDRSKFRTECWVERSILEERMCTADEHITFTPLNITIPVEGSERLFVSLSGLDSAETYWAKRLLRAVGANVQSAFSKSTSHLICPSGRGEKFRKAEEWKIPVVNLEWLFFIARNGKVPAHQDFEVKNDAPQNVAHASKHISSQVSESKSKEKVPELQGREEKIVDITNNHSQEILPCISPDLPHCSEETSSVMGCPTAYRALIPISTNSTTSFSSLEVQKNMDLSFGEAIGLRVPGSPTVTEKGYDTRGRSLRSSHPPEGPKTSQIVENKPRQIPSSCSPSPLQMTITNSTRTLSPIIGETRGLRTAITALLGKRAPEPKSDELAGQKRPTKRPRPHSRPPIEPDRPVPSLISLVTTSASLSCLSGKEESIPSEEESGSLGVIYEDPDQREEKRRLIALFEKSSMVPGSADEVIALAVKQPDEISETTKRKKTARRPNRSSGRKG